MPVLEKDLRKPVTAIPKDWLKAASFLVDLRHPDTPPLTEDEWQVVIDWLAATTFDDRSYLAGEVGAGLIRDLAPQHVKERVPFTDSTDRWQQHFQKIVDSDVNRELELRFYRPTPPAATLRNGD